MFVASFPNRTFYELVSFEVRTFESW
jgi:hypothetical protein